MASGNSYSSLGHNPAAYYRAAEHSSYVADHHHRPQQATAEYTYRQQSQQHWSAPSTTRPISNDMGPMGGATTSTSALTPNTYAPNALVATGKKRKRLQRACVACHKAKRRCDGGLPCSNCDFSGRTCAYSDSQGKAVPPTKRSLRPSEAASMQQQQQQQQQHEQRPQYDAPQHPLMQPSMLPAYQQSYVSATSPSQQRLTASQTTSMGTYHVGNTAESGKTIRELSQSPRSSHHSPRSSPSSSSRASVAEPAPEIRRELFSIFFTSIQPWSCLIDEITLLRDVSSMTASPAMLFAIYALAARHAYRRRQSDERMARLYNEVGNGLSYAAQARRVLHKEDSATGLSILDSTLELESRQALCLLACFEYECGRYQRASQYITLCCKGLINAGASEARHHRQQRKQLLKRITCIAAVLDVCIATTCGRSPLLRWWDLQQALDSMKVPATPLLSKTTSNREEDVNACLLHLLQVALLFSKTMDVYRALQFSSGDSSDARRQIKTCEEYLQQWADRLPNRLRFDETNLQTVERTLLRSQNDQHGEEESDGYAHMSSFMALCWCAMHVFAESSTIALQRVKNNSHLPLAAAQNLAMILERSNVSTFGGPLSSFGIIVLRAACAVYETERRTSAMRANGFSDDLRAGAWSDVVSATNRVQAEAGLVEDQVATAIEWLGFCAASDGARGNGFRFLSTSPVLNASTEAGNRFRSISLISNTIAKPYNRGSLSPVRSSASGEDDDVAAPSLKSRHESSASSSTGSVTSTHGVSTHVHQLPPLLGLSNDSAASMRKAVTATSPMINSTNTLPPLRFPSPDRAASLYLRH